MKFNPGDEVVIVGDLLNLGLPLNELAIVVYVNVNLLDYRNYLIRIPKKKADHWVCEKDIELASVVNAQQADVAMREYMINVSLETKDKELFNKATQSGAGWQ
ncbi:hypothetical protein SD70_02415 [Gordoniibacillus kamchatkensis]|uniref:Uncharacterized protein n=2 Tax=Gordoniibacillus kamchatkensis TaxID=1590651 RepID=A0ABR5AM01_9BACL|nr:hypothetical protein SD70_02415 [Paenibacillus sp. VKM B-2647]